MKTGKIRVDSENLMPIIKKWLYSDKDIFLREVVANSCDAISKLKKLRSIGAAEDTAEAMKIVVRVDKANGKLSITDNGIGMTEEEVVKYITQVAFSGASDFISKYSETNGDGIIGHFGLGFFSTFMVSSTVEVDTLSYTGSEAVHFESDGGEEYSLTPSDRTERGTTVTLNIADGEGEFLESYKISELLHKYCEFMPYPIYLETIGDESEHEHEHEDGCECEDPECECHEHEDKAPEAINNCSPLYLKQPKDCTREEYIDFYKQTFHDFDEPLMWVHLNVDYPFNLRGILYFPKLKEDINVYQGEIKLYSNQVFIADNIKEIIPEFLMLLKGVIDSPDIPLNVSRSFLQNDREVKKLSNHITKKVGDKIRGMFVSDREALEKCWSDVSPFIKFGCIKNEDFYENVKDGLIFKTINDRYVTLSELCENKGDVYYVSAPDAQSQYVKLYREAGIEAVILDHYVDNHFISFLEYKNKDIKFKRVDSELPKAETNTEGLDVAVTVELFKGIAGTDYKVELQQFAGDLPCAILADESKRRFNEMSKMYGEMFGGSIPDQFTLTVNTASPIIKGLADMDEEKKQTVATYCFRLAKLARGQLTADELAEFLASGVALAGLVK